MSRGPPPAGPGSDPKNRDDGRGSGATGTGPGPGDRADVRAARRRGDGRGASAVVAFVLLVGIVVVGSVGVVVLGGTAVSEERTQAENERVKVAFQNLDKRMDTVARGEASRREVDVNLGDEQGGAVRERDAGRIVISRTNVTAGNTDVLVNRSMGAIVYEGNGETYAIQGGGVWQGTGNGTQVVSPPPVSYATTEYGTEPTLTVPIVEAAGDRRLVDDRVRVTHNETISPLNDVSVVEGDLVVVRIESEYYVGWGEYFRGITNDAAVEYDHANDTAIVRMIVPTIAPPVEGGVVSAGTSGTLKLKQDAEVDSYNSTVDPYASSSGGNSRVVAGGDVELRQRATVLGDLEAGGDVTFKQDAQVQGNFRYDDSSTIDYHSPGTHVTGWKADNASVGTRTAVDGVIDRNVLLVRDSNDNASAPISDGRLQGCDSGGGCELDAGAYYLERIDLDNSEELVLNTTDGEIYLVVQNDVQLEDFATIRVEGPSRVSVYVDGETGSKDFAMFHDAEVTVPGDRAPQLWVYVDSDAEVRFRQRAEFTGVVYGPGPGQQEGAHITMSTTDEIHVYGAVVGDVAPITQEVKVHYDEALATETPIRTATAVPRLTFLHVSVHRVDVENAD